METGSFEIQGHRGCRGVYPENTLVGFSQAIRYKVDVLELDLLMTADGQIVIFHDFFLNPQICQYCNGTAIQLPSPLICSLSLDELKRIDCGSLQHPMFPEQQIASYEQIPTLEELFLMLINSGDPHAKKVKLNLEIKRDARHPDWTPPLGQYVQSIIELVQKYQFSERVYYSSFDMEALEQIQLIDPKAKLGCLGEENLPLLIEHAMRLKAEIISPEQQLIKSAKAVQELHARGFKVVTWTVNDLDRAHELLKWGVDGLITDYPQKFLKELKGAKGNKTA